MVSTGDQIKVGDIRGEGIAVGRNARVEINRYTEIIVRPDSFEDVPPAPGEPPYKGLTYFTEADAENFFGRETLSEAIVNRLNKTRFLAVIGASGSGKSSLLRAGVVPRLRQQNWLIQIMTPTAQPLQRLANVLVSGESLLSAADDLEAQLSGDPRTLHLAANRLAGQSNASNMLLVIDQFEELYTLCREESRREAFINNLLTAVDEEGSLTLLIGLRADFYGRVSEYEALRTLVSQEQEYIGPMRQEDLVRVVAEPARRGGWQLVEGLVEQILEDTAGEPGYLPLLSHALLETWDLRRGTVMTLGGYRSAGGVEGAIARTAEDTLQRMDSQQAPLVKHIFLSLTELGEGAEDTRRIASLSELQRIDAGETAVNAVLEELVRARLITVDDDQVQVAHEALIRRWPRLRSWIDEDRERLSFSRRLSRAAQEWEENDRQPDYLFRGAQLAQAESRIEEYQTWALTPEQEVFVNASRESAALAALEEQKIEETGRKGALLTYVVTTAAGAVGLVAAVLLIIIMIPRINPEHSFGWDLAAPYLIGAILVGAVVGFIYVGIADLITLQVARGNRLLSWSIAILTGIVAFLLALVWLFAFLPVDNQSIPLMAILWGGSAGAGRLGIQHSDRPRKLTVPLVTLLAGIALTLSYWLVKGSYFEEVPFPYWLIFMIGTILPLFILVAEFGSRYISFARK